jgi:hypothetical protein
VGAGLIFLDEHKLFQLVFEAKFDDEKKMGKIKSESE